ncbi:MAG: hypothetical protein BWY71_00119 [Planctomycetes bacterium ADurb.Bin412]|nr:MAG: hypothetical protein BWY71_00119 [Planctomycetes bacterium ADurb.Bin412]
MLTNQKLKPAEPYQTRPDQDSQTKPTRQGQFDFDRPLFRNSDTSQKAGIHIQKMLGKKLRAKIYYYLKAYGPKTNEELAEDLHIKYITVTPRISELVELKLVLDSGQRRPTSSGRQAIVWKAV